MFCPNCGAQNQDTATACTKCGFALKAAASAPKFKGTMLMMNAPTAAKPAAPAPAAPAAPVPAAPAAAAPGPAAPVAPKPKLKGTMIGVAPPSLGSNSPPVPQHAAPAPAAVPPPPDFGAPPAGFGAPPPGFGAPPPGDAPPGFGAPPPGFGAPPPGYGAPPAHAPSSAVNPLGGTVVADASAFGGAFPPAPAPGSYEMGGPPAGFGAPQASEDPALGATAPVMGGVGGGAMQPVPPAPMAEYEEDMPIPGTVGGSNPIVTVLLIVLTCGVYGIYLLVKGKKQDAS